jgi:hypothetical protein
MAVTTAAAMPRGVREFRDRARYTRRRVMGTEISGFMVLDKTSRTDYLAPRVQAAVYAERDIYVVGDIFWSVEERLIRARLINISRDISGPEAA